MELNLPGKLLRALEKEASDARITVHPHIVKKLERITPPLAFIDPAKLKEEMPKLVAYLGRVPSVRVISHEVTSDAYWWAKFEVDIHHPLAWMVVQALAFVFNEISISEKLPTVFKPTSPPPYLNGGPDESLFWVVESTYNYISPLWIAEILEERLPRPVDDTSCWQIGCMASDDLEDEWIDDYPHKPPMPPAQQNDSVPARPTATPPPLPTSKPPPLPPNPD